MRKSLAAYNYRKKGLVIFNLFVCFVILPPGLLLGYIVICCKETVSELGCVLQNKSVIIS